MVAEGRANMSMLQQTGVKEKALESVKELSNICSSELR